MKFLRKVFATIASFIVDVIGGSYLADITFLNKIYYKKDNKTKKKDCIYDDNLVFNIGNVVLHRNCIFSHLFK
ncbi:hypothetical protein SCO02_20500 [Staphylococcus ureilyticus]|uniref:Uncharacterized protein n=1 Tax=Staphylococcus ureilyticus TaxID=94138 RepID=A0AB34AKS8_STAUR|nr:hypothetical protein CEQ12_03825 [Staphylococcus cohnii]OJT33479.1 hypothetical protein BSF33_10405 [Staphylococcus ureilyticus]RXZ29774.1 hypothetical protein ESM34_02495 [Staphylococcus sp. SNAZ 59]RXZ37156.1 hypothetical protein ESM33_06645 [Staphylococcus sp. SNAZ 36]RXZ41586.1 hypothetical protein ESM35_04700 [Staphylococcus sp. SNAZ 75]